MATAKPLAAGTLAVSEDNFESLKRIIQRRSEGSHSQPLRVYISTSCPDCRGPGDEGHFGSQVRAWVDANVFQVSTPKYADVIVVEGTLSDQDKAEAFTEITDHQLLTPDCVSFSACGAAFQLQRLVDNERGRLKIVHIYTYQQY